jgi:hypothetical protein
VIFREKKSIILGFFSPKKYHLDRDQLYISISVSLALINNLNVKKNYFNLYGGSLAKNC